MQVASELLGLTPPAPLSAILVARPVRVCVVVPAVEGVAWERLVEHALATQTRVWGGAYNLVVPGGWELADDELFWRLIDCFDPDLVALHLPTLADVEEISPEKYTEAVGRVDQELRNLEFDEEARTHEIARLRDQVLWGLELSAAFRSKLVERIAPLHMGDDAPESVYVDGTNPPSYPLTDVAVLSELPGTVLDIRSTLDEVDQLLLTNAVGRLLPSFKGALEERGVTTNDVLVEHETPLFGHAWPRGRVVSDFGYPRRLAEIGLARRLSIADREQVIVVVGGELRDFLLYQGLSRLRPHIYWLPTQRFDNQAFLNALAQAVRDSVRTTIGRGGFAVTTAASEEAAAAAVELLNGLPGRDDAEATLVEWQKALPRSTLWSGDARSERRVSLLRHEGETQELQTPTPVSVSVPADDPSRLRWMVDVDVQGWRPARHPSLGTQVLRGSLISSPNVRTSTTGPSYFGLGPFVQAFFGLEGSTARPRLRPRGIVEQVTDVLQPLGWDVSLSDKGAYALQSAGLFGGLEGFANALRSEPTRALLDAYLTPTTNNPTSPRDHLDAHRRRTPS